MTEHIRTKIEKIEEYVRILEKAEKDCLDRFTKDPMYRGAVLHYLYLTSEIYYVRTVSCISLAEMLIRLKGLRTPQSYQESIDILGEQGIIPAEFAFSFSRIASFRNFLARDYEKMDYQKICMEAMEKLEEVKKYLAYIRPGLIS
jgi:uncharacterized protein YutE (UPF0331/DUF86 family)